MPSILRSSPLEVAFAWRNTCGASRVAQEMYAAVVVVVVAVILPRSLGRIESRVLRSADWESKKLARRNSVAEIARRRGSCQCV